MESKGGTTPGTMGTLEKFSPDHQGPGFLSMPFFDAPCRAFLRDTIFSSPSFSRSQNAFWAEERIFLGSSQACLKSDPRHFPLESSSPQANSPGAASRGAGGSHEPRGTVPRGACDPGGAVASVRLPRRRRRLRRGGLRAGRYVNDMIVISFSCSESLIFRRNSAKVLGTAVE